MKDKDWEEMFYIEKERADYQENRADMLQQEMNEIDDYWIAEFERARIIEEGVTIH